MKVRNIAGIGVLVLAALLASGCSLILDMDGDAYLAYYWNETLDDYIYDENPSLPATVYNGEYFETDAGIFYMEYSTVNDPGWYCYYEITKDEGSLFSEGDERYFALGLLSTGPKIYQSDTPQFDRKGSASTAVTSSSTPSGRARGPVLGHQEIVSNGYRLSLDYGKLE